MINTFTFSDLQNKYKLSGKDKGVVSIPVGMSMDGEIETIQPGVNSRHIAITGHAGSGKSTLLHSLICSILQSYSAQEVQLILHDSGMCEFRLFEELPFDNIRTVSTAEDPKHFLSLLNELRQEIKHRENVLTAAGVDSYAQYAQKYSKSPFSHLIVVLDCSYQLLKWLGAPGDALQTILQKGYALNIFFIIAGHDNAVLEYLPESIQHFFDTRILTHQGVDSAYRQLLGDREYAQKAQHLYCGEAIINKPASHIIRIPYLDSEAERQIYRNLISL